MPLAKSFALLAILLFGGAADGRLPSGPRIQVDVSLTGHDGLTQRLESTLQRHVSLSDDLELSSGGGNAFRITTAYNVVPDVLDGRRVIVYRALLLRNDQMLVDKLGVCFERDVGKCAGDILRGFRQVMLHPSG